MTGRYLFSSSPAYNAVGANCTSQLQQVGSLPIVDGVTAEFMARHTVDQGLLDSVYQSTVAGNGTALWNGEQAGDIAADFSASQNQGNCTFEQVLREMDLIREQIARRDREQREVQEIESSQLRERDQVGSLPFVDGITDEFMARHTVDQGLLDSVYQSAVRGNGTTLWNGEQAGGIAADFSASQNQGDGTFEQVLREMDLIREQIARRDREQREVQEIESSQLQQLHVCVSN